MFFGTLILTQADHFDKAIAFAKWPILKMVSFLEYLVFFRAVFLHRATLMCLKNGFLHFFFGILILDPTRPFLQGYSLCNCKMADFMSFLEYLAFFLAVFCTELL